MTYLQVALDVPLPRLFDYRQPANLPLEGGWLGRRVAVDFGRQHKVGIVVATTQQSDFPAEQIKPIASAYDEILPAATLQLARFVADYYQAPLGEVLLNLLPVSLRACKTYPDRRIWQWQAVDSTALQAQLPPRAHGQRRLAAALAAPLTLSECKSVSAQASTLLQQWLTSGWLLKTEVPSTPLAQRAQTAGSLPQLTEDQAAALCAMQAEGFAVHLLAGITGSGKTEVYLRLAASCLARGHQALLLVPEINLTPQFTARFRQRFPHANIVTLTSELADGERTDNWLAAQSGRADLILGTRLAVFTPLPRLGLIVVDEEHDASYKQQDGVRYSARDIAIYRARQSNVAIVLGSATPSLESWRNADLGRYQRHPLRQRAVSGAQPPRLELLACSGQRLQDGLHPQLLAALNSNLQRGEQSLVFLNRRGFAPALFCDACGWLSGCRHCSARLTVHLSEGCLRCHHCGHEEALPPACPGCGNHDILPVGLGTQKLESILAQRFPAARLLRIDRDSTRRKGSLDNLLAQAHSGEADILIGTQLLAKGHDFQRLSLVAILGADNGLFAADFRAAERLYSQLTQVAGRAGRAELPGRVLIQTRFADHPLYAALLRQDYAGFARTQLQERQQAGFPPFCYQAVLRADGPQLIPTLDFLRAAQQCALPLTGGQVMVYDPVAASMARLAGRERAQLLVQSYDRRALQAFLPQWLDAVRQIRRHGLRWHLDIDPLEL